MVLSFVTTSVFLSSPTCLKFSCTPLTPPQPLCLHSHSLHALLRAVLSISTVLTLTFHRRLLSLSSKPAIWSHLKVFLLLLHFQHPIITKSCKFYLLNIFKTHPFLSGCPNTHSSSYPKAGRVQGTASQGSVHLSPKPAMHLPSFYCGCSPCD